MEEKRSLVLNRLITGKLDVPEAALLLGLSERQVWRLKARFLVGGPEALVHRNRGRAPANRLDPDFRAQVAAFARDGYAGLNDSHLRDLLAEREGICLSRASVQRILRATGIPSPRTHRAPRYRSRRERRAAAGMLLQLDGSRERWFAEVVSCLQLAVDDATGRIVGAIFREEEDGAGYLEVLRQVLQGFGVPLAVYTDRHGVFHRTLRERASLERPPGCIIGSSQATCRPRGLWERC